MRNILISTQTCAVLHVFVDAPSTPWMPGVYHQVSRPLSPTPIEIDWNNLSISTSQVEEKTGGLAIAFQVKQATIQHIQDGEYRDRLEAVNRAEYGFAPGNLRPHWFDSTKGWTGSPGKLGDNHGQWRTIITPAALHSPWVVAGTYRNPKTGKVTIPANPARAKEKTRLTPDDYEAILESEGLGVINESEIFSRFEPSTLDGDSPTAVVCNELMFNPRTFTTGAHHVTPYEYWIGKVMPAWTEEQTKARHAETARDSKVYQRALRKVKTGKNLNIQDQQALNRFQKFIDYTPAPYRGDMSARVA